MLSCISLSSWCTSWSRPQSGCTATLRQAPHAQARRHANLQATRVVRAGLSGAAAEGAAAGLWGMVLGHLWPPCRPHTRRPQRRSIGHAWWGSWRRWHDTTRGHGWGRRQRQQQPGGTSRAPTAHRHIRRGDGDAAEGTRRTYREWRAAVAEPQRRVIVRWRPGRENSCA